MNIKKKLKSLLFGRRKLQNFWKFVHKISLLGMNLYGDSEFQESGELLVIKYLADNLLNEKSIVFDIGANIGDYCQQALNFTKADKIHCFEPSSETFNMLKNNVHSDRVVFNNFGISNQKTSSTLYSDKSGSGLASLYNRQLDNFGIHLDKLEEVKLDTIDNYCKENNITQIDYIKLDIEGNELNALLGAKDFLAEKKIKAIQIEFGGCNLDSRTYFRDFWNLLSKDFKVMRVLKDGLFEIKEYDPFIEVFGYSNYLFLLK